MKTKLSILLIILSGTIIGQPDHSNYNQTSQNPELKEVNIYQDTIWVMDSSYSYHSYFDEFYLMSVYKVLTRDNMANNLTAITKSKRNFWDQFENSSFDSTFYFEGTNDIHFEKSFTWDKSDKKWMISHFELFDEKQKKIEYFDKKWDEDQNLYTSGYYYISWNTGDRLDSSIIKLLNPPDDSWQNVAKSIYFSDSSGTLNYSIHYNWDNTYNRWMKQSKSEYFWDEYGRITEYFLYYYDTVSAGWQNNSHQIYTYYKDELFDTIIEAKWDTLQGDWIPNRKNWWTYNDNDQYIKAQTFIYNSSIKVWQPEKKLEYEYEILQKTITNFGWDTISESWINQTKEIRSFLNSDLIDTLTFTIWDSLSGQWEGYWREIHSYDKRLNLFKLTQFDWDTENNNWFTVDYKQYFWSKFSPATVDEITENRLTIFPNPSRDKLTIKNLLPIAGNSQLEVYDLFGRKINELQIPNGQTEVELVVVDWKEGIYLIKLRQEGKLISTEKVVVKH